MFRTTRRICAVSAQIESKWEHIHSAHVRRPTLCILKFKGDHVADIDDPVEKMLDLLDVPKYSQDDPSVPLSRDERILIALHRLDAVLSADLKKHGGH